MSKIELSINVDYLPRWGTWEGIRELVQNARDAEIERRAKMAIDHRGGVMMIQNEGVVLTKEALLFGTTSKTNRPDLIGQFGEGLKLGLLALVRQGIKVTVRTGGEIWTPTIERSEQYAAKVLVINTRKAPQYRNAVIVEIHGIDAEAWSAMRERFLFVTPPTDEQCVEAGRGSLLLGDRFRGRVYVKGIHVYTDDRFENGYDFKYLAVDRDRKMVDGSSVQAEMVSVWRDACVRRPDLIDPFFRMMLEAKADLSGVEYNGQFIDQEVRQAVVEQFLGKFGADAVPVSNLAESQEIEHLGKRGIVVPAPLGAVLRAQMGDAKQALRDEVLEKLSWHALTHVQKDSLSWAAERLREARPDFNLDVVDVCRYRRKSLHGRYTTAARIEVSVLVLENSYETLAVLVHEYSHKHGADASKQHVHHMEDLWRDLYRLARTS